MKYILGIDVHHTSITTWEIKTCAALLSSSHEFHDRFYGLVLFNPPTNKFAAFCNYLLRCDATNTAVCLVNTEYIALRTQGWY